MPTTETPPQPEYVPVRQVATRLGVSPNAVRSLVETGALVGVRVGRLLRVEAASVDRYLIASRVGRAEAGR